MNLDDAIEEYARYRSGMGFSVNTVKADKAALKKFMAVTGNIRCKSLGPHHGEMYLSWMLSIGYKPRTVNLFISCLSSFAKWAVQRRFMGGNQNLLGTVRYQKVVDAPRRRVPVGDFPRLLDAADCEQSRILIALGLYLFLRSSEIVGLRLGDVDLEAGEIRVYQPKTKRWDTMPICAELDEELRRWLAFYAEDVRHIGPLRPDWYLTPSRSRHRIDLREPQQLEPTSRISNTSRKVHPALRGIGWEFTGEDAEGVHTLRRSGARALFDDLVARQDRARDDALRVVSAMLHHKSITQTEVYLGLEADREKRDVLLRGERMFAQTDHDNVVEIGVAR